MSKASQFLDVHAAKAAAFRLETKKASKAQVASALRLWHQFAIHVLGYDPAATLPPRAGAHIEAFLGSSEILPLQEIMCPTSVGQASTWA